MNEEELSKTMRASLPARPDVRGWADGARRRARNRRLSVVGAALVAVVAISTPFAIQNNREAPPPVVLATPSPTPFTAAQLVPDACLDPVADAQPLVDDDLPEGAERIWLCGRADTQSALVLVGAPDPLVARAGDAARAFNAMETGVGVMDCMPNPLDYTVVAEYANGEHRAARIAGCGDLRDVTNMFEVYRDDGAGYLETLAELWAAERAETGFAFTGFDGLCDSNHTSVLRPLDGADLTRVIACADLPDGTRRDVTLPDDVTADVLASLRVDAAPWSSEIGVAGGPPALVLLTPAGDPLSVSNHALPAGQDEAVDAFVWNDGTTNMLWTMPEDLQARIQEHVDTAVAEGPTAPPATSPPTIDLPSERGEGLVPIVCDDIHAGSLRVPDLPAARNLPEGAAGVWLCGGSKGLGGAGRILGPVEPLTVNPDRVVAAINDLPAAEGEECSAEGGIVYTVVIDYADGERRVISAEAIGCQLVGGGSGRAGGSELLRTLGQFWSQQREATPEPFVDDVRVCDAFDVDGTPETGLNSVWQVQRGELYRGFVCGLPADGAEPGAEWIQRELPAELMMPITQAEPTGTDGVSQSPGMPFVVMLTQFGDPVTYPVDDELRIIMDRTYWAPEGEAATAWAEVLEGLRTTPI